MSQSVNQVAKPQPDPWRMSPAASLVMTASVMRAVATRIGDASIGGAMTRAVGAVLKENGFPNPDDPEPHGPGGPVEGLATAAALLHAAAQLPTGQVRKDLVGTAKRLIGEA